MQNAARSVTSSHFWVSSSMNSGNPVGAVDDLICDLLGQRFAAGDVDDHLGALSRRQAVERYK
jgi:hypothetical protein